MDERSTWLLLALIGAVTFLGFNVVSCQREETRLHYAAVVKTKDMKIARVEP